MRSIVLTLSLAMALPMIPTVAAADSHSCNQLRQTVFNRAPSISRDLPFGALTCDGISAIHLLLIRRNTYTPFDMNQRIEAIFRGEGLIR
ncbi:hypothetical protein [Hasllibacter sp. MH4015]|uniref:hypothetical protein n=1 Tax=Hasllibacter sp. MH4015 TaxID=2854029 RepID=UPI001CD4196D|nr:hypothetical protein [Hasllibacter sp. MH4015]